MRKHPVTKRTDKMDEKGVAKITIIAVVAIAIASAEAFFIVGSIGIDGETSDEIENVDGSDGKNGPVGSFSENEPEEKDGPVRSAPVGSGGANEIGGPRAFYTNQEDYEKIPKIDMVAGTYRGPFKYYGSEESAAWALKDNYNDKVEFNPGLRENPLSEPFFRDEYEGFWESWYQYSYRDYIDGHVKIEIDKNLDATISGSFYLDNPTWDVEVTWYPSTEKLSIRAKANIVVFGEKTPVGDFMTVDVYANGNSNKDVNSTDTNTSANSIPSDFTNPDNIDWENSGFDNIRDFFDALDEPTPENHESDLSDLIPKYDRFFGSQRVTDVIDGMLFNWFKRDHSDSPFARNPRYYIATFRLKKVR